MTKEERMTEKEGQKNTSKVAEKSIDTDGDKRAGRLAYKAEVGSTLERRSSDPKSGVQSQGKSLEDSLGIAHDGWRLSAGEVASDKDRREQDEKKKKMDREKDRDKPVIKVHVTMKLLKGVMEANTASLDHFPERKALVDEIYVLGRRITVLEDLFNEQVRPMRDLVSTLIRAANSDLDDTEILSAAKALRQAEDLQRRLPKDYHAKEVAKLREKIYVTQDEERREQWSKVTGTKFLYDVFLSHDHGGKGSTKTDKEGIHIMSSLFTDSFISAQEGLENRVLCQKITQGLEQKGWSVFSDNPAPPVIREGGREVGMRLTCEGIKEEAHLILVLPKALAALASKVVTDENTERCERQKAKAEKERKEREKEARNSRTPIEEKKKQWELDGVLGMTEERTQISDLRRGTDGKDPGGRAGELFGARAGVGSAGTKRFAGDEVQQPEICIINEKRFEIVGVSRYWEKKMEEEGSPFGEEQEEHKEGEGEGRWITYCDLRIVESVRFRADTSTDKCTCEEVASAIYIGVMAKDEKIALEEIACYACAWPWGLAPRLKTEAESDQERVLKAMRLSVLVAPIVTNLYYSRAQPSSSQSQAYNEVRSIGKAKSSTSIVPLVFGHVGMPHTWRGHIGDAMAQASGVDCTGLDGVQEAVDELEVRLRKMGLRPRGEKDEEVKEKEKVASLGNEPSRKLFLDALSRSVDDDREETAKGVTDTDTMDTLRRLQMRGVHGSADALRLAYGLPDSGY